MDYTTQLDDIEQLPSSDSSSACTDDLEWLSYTKPLGTDRKLAVHPAAGPFICIHSAGNAPGDDSSGL